MAKDLNYYRERCGDLIIENEELKRRLADAERKIETLQTQRDAAVLEASRARQPAGEFMDL